MSDGHNTPEDHKDHQDEHRRVFNILRFVVHTFIRLLGEVEAYVEVEVGDEVLVYNIAGIVRYVGFNHFAGWTWIGIRLCKPFGLNRKRKGK